MGLPRHSQEDEDDDDLELQELDPRPVRPSTDEHSLLPSRQSEDDPRHPVRARWMDDAPKPVRKYVLAFAICTGLALIYEYYLVFFAAPFGPTTGTRVSPYAERYGQGAVWPGWAGIEHVFIFGDSWTTTGFDLVDNDGKPNQQPSVANPMGNPEYVSPSNWERLGTGTNWVPYLTGMHNASFVKTVNLAYGGATVDMELIHPFDEIPPGMRPLKYQVEEQFIPNYTDEASLMDWRNESTVFIVWIGLNDIHNATPETAQRFGLVFKEFADFVDELYRAGARNFMFMNIPPIERSPLAFKIEQVEPWRSWVAAWNHNVTMLSSNLSKTYDDSTVFVFDTYKLYDTVIDKPCSHPETCAFQDTTTFCGPYAFTTPQWNSSNENCTYRVDEYLWMNDLHPTTRMHNLTALMMAEALT